MEEPALRALVVKRPWGVHTVADVVGSPDCATGLPDGRWVRSVPEPYSGNRIVAAWWVLTGRANAIIWPSAADLANALNPYEPTPERTKASPAGPSRDALRRNARVQARYDDLMREGKHGHYETMFRVVREEVQRATSSADG